MSRPAIETYWEDDRWHNRRQDEEEPFASYQSKDAAEEDGRETAISDGVEHIVKNQDGMIAERQSYGNDPPEIPG